LVSGYSHRDLTAEATPGRDGKREGNFEIFYKATDGGTPINVTKQITGGELGGVLEVRDKICNQYIQDMDKVAYHLAYEVNRAHVQGFDRYGKTGNLFFDMPASEAGAASSLKVSKTISNDVGRIAAAAQPGAA